MADWNFKSIFSSLLLASGLLLLTTRELQAQHKPKNTTESQKITKESRIEMLEIGPDKLPEELRRDIHENFPGAEIIKAYKVWRPGAKQHEYWVDVKQGSKKWALQFDADGKSVHKVHPMP
jgi:hypothetical protein